MENETGAIINRPCGIETEFGIMVANPFSATHEQSLSGRLFFQTFNPEWIVSAHPHIPWNASSRLADDPDAREHDFFNDPKWKYSENMLLPNGARLYLDGSQLEISTPLCFGEWELVCWNRACYALVDAFCKKQRESSGIHFRVFRNNVAGEPKEWRGSSVAKRRSSFGCHENYTTRRAVPFERLTQCLGRSWFIARTPIIGAGKVGCDETLLSHDVKFQISQRADFFSALQGSQTTYDRPLFNTRDVPYADPSRFRRVHVIAGDANMLQLPEYLKIGLTSLALMMIEDNEFPRELEFCDPVSAFHRVSWDMKFEEKYDIVGSTKQRSITYILQKYRDYFGEYILRRYPKQRGLKLLMRFFSDISDCLEKKDFPALYGKLDWVTKFYLLDAYIAKSGKSWKSAEVAVRDYLYHDNDHTDGLFFRGPKAPFAQEKKLVSERMIGGACVNTPKTRSRFIVETTRTYAENIISSNYWDKIYLKDPLDGEKTLVFSDPTCKWRDEDKKLFLLPWKGFVVEAMRSGIASIEPRYPSVKSLPANESSGEVPKRLSLDDECPH
ncbi:MAG: proteasome accessory factor PafA2 family protein [Patescibacteria group bacterium]